MFLQFYRYKYGIIINLDLMIIFIITVPVVFALGQVKQTFDVHYGEICQRKYTLLGTYPTE